MDPADPLAPSSIIIRLEGPQLACRQCEPARLLGRRGAVIGTATAAERRPALVEPYAIQWRRGGVMGRRATLLRAHGAAEEDGRVIVVVKPEGDLAAPGR